VQDGDLVEQSAHVYEMSFQRQGMSAGPRKLAGTKMAGSDARMVGESSRFIANPIQSLRLQVAQFTCAVLLFGHPPTASF
jgi:hypothetical protein